MGLKKVVDAIKGVAGAVTGTADAHAREKEADANNQAHVAQQEAWKTQGETIALVHEIVSSQPSPMVSSQEVLAQDTTPPTGAPAGVGGVVEAERHYQDASGSLDVWHRQEAHQANGQVNVRGETHTVRQGSDGSRETTRAHYEYTVPEGEPIPPALVPTFPSPLQLTPPATSEPPSVIVDATPIVLEPPADDDLPQ